MTAFTFFHIGTPRNSHAKTSRLVIQRNSKQLMNDPNQCPWLTLNITASVISKDSSFPHGVSILYCHLHCLYQLNCYSSTGLLCGQKSHLTRMGNPSGLFFSPYNRQILLCNPSSLKNVCLISGSRRAYTSGLTALFM